MRGPSFLPSFLLLSIFTIPLLAQDPNYELRVTDAWGKHGKSVDVQVLLNDQGDALLGWSLGVAHDPAYLTLSDVVDGATTQTVQGGNAPDFDAINMYSGSSPGWTVGVVIDFYGVEQLAPGSNYELNVATYHLDGPNGTQTSLDFTDALGSPPTFTAVITATGNEVTPLTHSGTVTIDTSPPAGPAGGGSSPPAPPPPGPLGPTGCGSSNPCDPPLDGCDECDISCYVYPSLPDPDVVVHSDGSYTLCDSGGRGSGGVYGAVKEAAFHVSHTKSCWFVLVEGNLADPVLYEDTQGVSIETADLNPLPNIYLAHLVLYSDTGPAGAIISAGGATRVLDVLLPDQTNFGVFPVVEIGILVDDGNGGVERHGFTIRDGYVDSMSTSDTDFIGAGIRSNNTNIRIMGNIIGNEDDDDDPALQNIVAMQYASPYPVGGGAGIGILPSPARTVVIADNTIGNNRVYVDDSGIFDPRETRNRGAGIYAEVCRPRIVGNTIAYNEFIRSAPGTEDPLAPAQGGGIAILNGGYTAFYTTATTAYICDNDIYGNVAKQGCGIYLRDTNTDVIDNRVYSNRSPLTTELDNADWGYYGGGIFLDRTDPIPAGYMDLRYRIDRNNIYLNDIYGNTDAYDNAGGGISDGTGYSADCDVSASGSSPQGNVIITNNIIAQNTAAHGGGIDVGHSTSLCPPGLACDCPYPDPLILYNTIADNNMNMPPNSTGGGVFFGERAVLGAGSFDGNILSSNQASVGDNWLVECSTLAREPFEYCRADDNDPTCNPPPNPNPGVDVFDVGMNGNIDNGPQFKASLAYHLQGISPCVDTGNSTINPALPLTDIDGDPRPYPGFGNQLDMGADEYTLYDFIRGDAEPNAPFTYTLGDPINILLFLFAGGSQTNCLAAYDVNDDDNLDLADPILLLGYEFNGGPPPADPFGSCGPDPTSALTGVNCDERSASCP